MSKIHFLVMDVDGTLSDGKIYIGPDGEVMKAFSCKDGYAITNIVPKLGIVPVIITGRNSKIMEYRCKELKIQECYQGIVDKTGTLKQILAKYSEQDGITYTAENVAYVGDDLNDYDCMQYVKQGGGLVGCPADAVLEVIEIASFVSDKDGGNGAVRQFIEWL